MGSSGGELAKRVGVALLGIPLAIGLAYLGGYWFAGFLAILAALAAREFFVINRSRGVPSFGGVGSFLALAIVLMAAVGVESEDLELAIAAVILVMVLGTPAVLGAPLESRPTTAIAVTLFGALYTGGLLAFAVWLRAIGDAGTGPWGAGILFLPVSVIWLADTAAYFTGRAVGRHRLAPTISPAKTWEGAVAGTAVAIGGALLYVELTRSLVDWTMSTVELAGFGFGVAIAGQAGDLVESKFKRDCGVKDSSGLLPGHGGILDRLDSLLFVFPVAYAYLKVVGV